LDESTAKKFTTRFCRKKTKDEDKQNDDDKDDDTNEQWEVFCKNVSQQSQNGLRILKTQNDFRVSDARSYLPIGQLATSYLNSYLPVASTTSVTTAVASLDIIESSGLAIISAFHGAPQLAEKSSINEAQQRAEKSPINEAVKKLNAIGISAVMENEIKPYFEHKLKTKRSKAEMKLFAREVTKYLICLSMQAENETSLQNNVLSLAQLKNKYAPQLHLMNMVNNQIYQSESLSLSPQQIKLAIQKLLNGRNESSKTN